MEKVEILKNTRRPGFIGRVASYGPRRGKIAFLEPSRLQKMLKPGQEWFTKVISETERWLKVRLVAPDMFNASRDQYEIAIRDHDLYINDYRIRPDEVEDVRVAIYDSDVALNLFLKLNGRIVEFQAELKLERVKRVDWLWERVSEEITRQKKTEKHTTGVLATLEEQRRHDMENAIDERQIVETFLREGGYMEGEVAVVGPFRFKMWAEDGIYSSPYIKTEKEYAFPNAAYAIYTLLKNGTSNLEFINAKLPHIEMLHVVDYGNKNEMLAEAQTFVAKLKEIIIADNRYIKITAIPEETYISVYKECSVAWKWIPAMPYWAAKVFVKWKFNIEPRMINEDVASMIENALAVYSTRFKEAVLKARERERKTVNAQSCDDMK